MHRSAYASVVICALLGCARAPEPVHDEATPTLELGGREPAIESEPELKPERGEAGLSLGSFRLTYYWLTELPALLEDEPVIELRTCEGEAIASAPVSAAKALRLEGSGKLPDGRVINVGGCSCAGHYACFVELDAERFPWGQGSRGNALQPFVSIATDPEVIAFGTRLYAPALEGVELPGGELHDGCLLAADVGGGIEGAHIDWFAGTKANYRELVSRVADELELFEGGTRCVE